MRAFLGTLLALVLSAAAACAADAVFPKGSAVGLVPPPGMVPSDTFSGFQDADRGVTILVSALPGGSFAELATAFSDDSKLAKRGVTIEKRESLTVGGNPAFLLIGRQQGPDGPLRKWIIIVGSPATLALVTAQYPDDAANTYTDDIIRNALLSVTFRAPQSLAEQVAALPFAVAAADGFRPLMVLGGLSLTLTNGPKQADPDHEQASFMVVCAAGKPGPAERGDFARREFSRITALKNVKSDREQDLVVAGMPAHEITGTAVSRSGVPLKLAHWMVFTEDGVVTMLALARPAEFDRLYPQFVAMRDSLHVK